MSKWSLYRSLSFPAYFRLPYLCLPSTAVVRILGRNAPFEYEIRIRWRTAHTSVYVCLNWPLYGNEPGAAHWKRIDSTRCVSRIEMTPVDRFASRYFRSKGFNIKPLSPSSIPNSLPRLRPSGIEMREHSVVYLRRVFRLFFFFFLVWLGIHHNICLLSLIKYIIFGKKWDIQYEMTYLI